MAEIEELIDKDIHDELMIMITKLVRKENHYQYLHEWEQKKIL